MKCVNKLGGGLSRSCLPSRGSGGVGWGGGRGRLRMVVWSRGDPPSEIFPRSTSLYATEQMHPGPSIDTCPTPTIPTSKWRAHLKSGHLVSV